MDRRTVLTGGIATGVYFWLPRITIAKTQDQISNLVVKTTDILVDNMELVAKSNASDDTQVSQEYRPRIKKARSRFVERGYSDYEAYAETPPRIPRRRAMLRVRHSDNVNHGNAYVTGDTDDPNNGIALLPLLPFVRHGQITTVAKRANFSKSQMAAYLFPSRKIDYMHVYLGDNITDANPLRVLCDEGIWVLTCQAEGRYAGHGLHTLYRKKDMVTLHSEHYEYNFG